MSYIHMKITKTIFISVVKLMANHLKLEASRISKWSCIDCSLHKGHAFYQNPPLLPTEGATGTLSNNFDSHLFFQIYFLWSSPLFLLRLFIDHILLNNIIAFNDPETSVDA